MSAIQTFAHNMIAGSFCGLKQLLAGQGCRWGGHSITCALLD
jgi:hypothetical protein